MQLSHRLFFLLFLATPLSLVSEALGQAVSQPQVLREYQNSSNVELAPARTIPITFGLENELSCKWALAMGACMSAAGALFLHHAEMLIPLGWTWVWYAHQFGPKQSTLSARVLLPLYEKWIRANPSMVHLVLSEKLNRWSQSSIGETLFALTRVSDGFQLRFKHDPYTLEITNTPFTLAQFNDGLDEWLDQFMFKIPEQRSVTPAFFLSGGHLNIGLKSAFTSSSDSNRLDLLALRNFVVDYFNHGELSQGALLYDPTSIAAKPALQNWSKRQEFIQSLAKFDQSLLEGKATFEDFFSILQNQGLNRKGLSIRLTSEVIEIRAVRAQKNITQLRMLLELFQARIELLTRVREPLPFFGVGPLRSYGQGLAQFKDYVEGSGLKWDRYQDLLPQIWRAHVPDPGKAYQVNPRSSLRPDFNCALFFINR